MPDLYSTIKRIALAAVEESQPTAVMVGTVTKTDPLKVTVEQRLPLDEEFVIVPETYCEVITCFRQSSMN